MLSINGSAELRQIVVLNPKGGVGKSTLASNLAGYFTAKGKKVAIIDMDSQGSSTHWLGRRPAEYPVIHGVFCAQDNPDIPNDISINLPKEIELAIVDTPAGILSEDLIRYTAGSHAVIVPVMPSEFDIHAASRLIADLLLEARVSRENRRLGVIANRVKERTIAFRQLMKFLNRLSIPVIGIVRDSQTYVSATREGISIHELTPSQAGRDLKYWESITEWLEQRLATPLNEKDRLQSILRETTAQRPHRNKWMYATAAVLVLLVASILLWDFDHQQEADLVVEPAAMVDGVVERQADEAGAGLQVQTQETFIESPVTAKPVEQQALANKSVKEDEGQQEPAIARQEDSTLAEMQPEQETAEVNEELPAVPLTPAEELTQKWRFKGVAGADGELFAILTDRSGGLTRTVTGNVPVDGWRLKEAGPGYAVLEKDGEEVRLKIGQ